MNSISKIVSTCGVQGSKAVTLAGPRGLHARLEPKGLTPFQPRGGMDQDDDFVHLKPENNFCADGNLVNDLRHVFPELALFLIHFGQDQHLVAGLNLCNGQPAVGIGLIEAAIAAGNYDAAVVGVLAVPTSALDVVL
jgi:hypothetical protein